MPLYRPEPGADNLADILAQGVGYVGTMAEYLLNTVTELARAGIHDPHLWRLQEMVAERLERLSPRPVLANGSNEAAPALQSRNGVARLVVAPQSPMSPSATTQE